MKQSVTSTAYRFINAVWALYKPYAARIDTGEQLTDKDVDDITQQIHDRFYGDSPAEKAAAMAAMDIGNMILEAQDDD